MFEETLDLLKDNLVKINKKVHQVSSELEKEKLKDKLLKVYLSSPSKVQFVLAKFVMKAVLNNKQRETDEPIRH